MIPAHLDNTPQDASRPDPAEPTFTIPLTRRWAICITLHPGWWILLAAPLTVMVCLIVIAVCAVARGLK